MENATKAILLGAGIVITLVLVSLGFFLLKGATGTVDAQLTEMESQKQLALEQKFTKYDNKTVNGSEVLNALQEFRDDEICIRIITNLSTTDYYFKLGTDDKLEAGGETDIGPTKVKTGNQYVNPSGKFKAEILRDNNDTITGIIFDQD